MDDNEYRAHLVDGYRKLADLFENENIPLPTYRNPKKISAFWYNLTKEQLADIARIGARQGLSVDKKYEDNYFRLNIDNGVVGVGAFISRSVVCRRVDTGKTETVQVLPKDIVYEEEERPVYDWVCDEPLLAGDK